MYEPAVEWRYSETRDSEYADTEIGDLSLQAQDCDGDFAYWHVKRGKKFLAAGEAYFDDDRKLYHFDVAMERAIIFARAILQAEKYNSMRDCEPCGGRAGSEHCEKCHGFGFYYADRPKTSEAADE